MLNSTMQSTRSGGPLAAAWAVTQRIGVEGYARPRPRRPARRPSTSPRRSDGIPGLRVLAAPDSTLVALVADESCDVFTVADEMLERGWFVQPQMSFGDVPPTLHLTLSAATAPSVPELVVALRESVDAARAAGPVAARPRPSPGCVGAIDPATLDEAGLRRAARRRRTRGGATARSRCPRRMAPVNALLDACPPPLREALLLGVLDRLSRPTVP